MCTHIRNRKSSIQDILDGFIQKILDGESMYLLLQLPDVTAFLHWVFLVERF